MFDKLEAYQSQAIGLFRIIAGLLYFAHGTQKLFNFPIPGPEQLSTLLLVSGLLEVVLGALIIVGFFTRPAAFVASGHMAVAYFMAHAPQSAFPAGNSGDAAILFCFGFLMLVATGAGAFSIDNARR